jgi:hypothetical protein
MLRSTILWAAAVVLAVLVLSPSAALPSCQGDAPEAVLGCFSRAYSERDLTMLEGVLAPDYIWVSVAPPEVDVFTRDASVSASAAMFDDPRVEFVALEFGDGYHVVEGDDEGTWRIEDLSATMTVKRASMDQSNSARLCVTLYVRATGGEEPGYEVFREVFFEGEGCVGK